MIVLTQLNGVRLVLNADMIETLVSTPDTVISLTTGRKLIVRETVAEVTERVESYLQRTHGQPVRT